MRDDVVVPRLLLVPCVISRTANYYYTQCLCRCLSLHLELGHVLSHTNGARVQFCLILTDMCLFT